MGYSGSGVFFAFFPDCPLQKLDVILKAIERQVEKYNKLNPGYEIRYVCGKAVSSADCVFEIRDLLRLAVQRMHPDTPSPEGSSDETEAEAAQVPANTEVTEKNSDEQ